MTDLAGTTIIDKIIPFDSNDTYPTHEDTYGLGGMRSVASLSVRNAIPSERRKEGMIVKVNDTDLFYDLFGGIDNSNWRILDIGSAFLSGGTFSINGMLSDPYNNIDFVGSSNILISANPYTHTILISAAPFAAYLGQLLDVSLTSPTNDQALVFDGTKWKNTPFGPSISGVGQQGIISCLPTVEKYTINHATLVDLTKAYPIVSLVIPTSADTVIPLAITNRTLSSFDVILNQVPNISGYFITWSLGNIFGDVVNNIFTTIISGNADIYRSEVVSATGNLQNQITSEAISRSNADSFLQGQIGVISGSYIGISSLSPYTLTTTTAGISANLQTQINGKANTSHDILTHTTGSMNSTLVLSPNGVGGVVWSTVSVSAAAVNHNTLSGLQGGTANEYFHLTNAQYLDLIGRTEVSGISATLNASRILGDNLLQNQLISVSGNYAQIGMLSPYTLTSTTAGISANLQGQLNSIPGSYASIGSLSAYTLTSTTAGISANLQNQINTKSSIGSLSPYTLTSTTSGISANLQGQLNLILGSYASIGSLSAYTPLSTTSDISGNLQNQINTKSSIGSLSPYTLTSTTAGISANLQNQITSEVNLRNSQVVALSANKLDKTGGVISSDLTIQGNLTVNGTQFIVNTQAVSARDNLIVINAGEVGAGVTAISAGILVDRGSLPRYAFLFDETTDRFKVGTVNNMQPVATREETPTSNAFPYWDSSSNRFKNSDSVITQSAGIVTVAGSSAGTASAGMTNIGGGSINTSNNINSGGSVFFDGNATVGIGTAGNGQLIINSLTGPNINFKEAGTTRAFLLANGANTLEMRDSAFSTTFAQFSSTNTVIAGSSAGTAAASQTNIGGGVIDTNGKIKSAGIIDAGTFLYAGDATRTTSSSGCMHSLGASNSASLHVLEVRQQRIDKDGIRLTTNQTGMSGKAIRSQQNGTDYWSIGYDGAASLVSITLGSTTLLSTSVALTNGAAAAAGTLLNAPSAGNPSKWIPIVDNGTTRWIPTW